MASAGACFLQEAERLGVRWGFSALSWLARHGDTGDSPMRGGCGVPSGNPSGPPVRYTTAPRWCCQPGMSPRVPVLWDRSQGDGQLVVCLGGSTVWLICRVWLLLISFLVHIWPMSIGRLMVLSCPWAPNGAAAERSLCLGPLSQPGAVVSIPATSVPNQQFSTWADAEGTSRSQHCIQLSFWRLGSLAPSSPHHPLPVTLLCTQVWMHMLSYRTPPNCKPAAYLTMVRSHSVTTTFRSLMTQAGFKHRSQEA